jgi:hypothetical protein
MDMLAVSWHGRQRAHQECLGYDLRRAAGIFGGKRFFYRSTIFASAFSSQTASLAGCGKFSSPITQEGCSSKGRIQPFDGQFLFFSENGLDG